jgi:hypothetical protein
MVHRANDSRLLANLIKSEKELESSFHGLLANSRASIASLQAYASSCSAATSRTIFAVTSAFLNAHEALNRYASSIDAWSDLLEEIMTLEDEVGVIVRDREIL